MAECQPGGHRRGGANSGARATKSKNEMSKVDSSGFEISEDGIQFTFPTWQNTTKDPSILNRFNASLKWVGGYAEDEEKKFLNDKSFMKFMNMNYYPSHSSRELKVNLNVDVEENVEPYTGTSKQVFFNLLLWILRNEDVFTQSLGLDEESDWKGGKFVTIRNVLSAIYNTYKCRQKNSFFATFYDGVVYLMKDEPLIEFAAFHYWGHRFKQLITHSQRNYKKLIINTAYRIVTSFCLGEHRMILSCATDSVNPDKYNEGMEDTSALIALRCAKYIPNNQRSKKLERYKMFDWCLALHFSGTPELVVGYRDNGGNVDVLKLYDRGDLIEKGQGHWDIESVFVFLQHLLSFVKDRTRSKPGAIFHFVKKDHSNIYTSSEAQKELLPEWFRNEHKRRFETSDKVPRG